MDPGAEMKATTENDTDDSSYPQVTSCTSRRKRGLSPTAPPAAPEWGDVVAGLESFHLGSDVTASRGAKKVCACCLSAALR